MIGRTLGHFRILEKLGAGGMGEVYRARDEHLERDVAIKVLPAGTLADDAARKRFRQEALALSKLNHPNIATVHEFATDSHVDFLVMEHVAGTTLDDKLAAGPLAEKEILLLGAELAEGLAAAHEQGVIHCDLKPGNLHVTADGRLKILDFGLARFLSPAGEAAATQSASQISDAAGTLPYMSPEQINGAPPDPRSDIYAAGAVLYEMATGQRLFPNEREPQRQLAAILHRAPRPPRALNPHISAGLESVILKCLEKDPEHRYQSAREILADLRRLGAGSTVPVPRTERTSSRALRLAAGALAVLLVGGGLSYWWHARASLTRQPAVLVGEFENRTGEPIFDQTLPELVTASLEQSHYLNVFPSSRVPDVLQRMEKPVTSRIDEEIGREICQREGLEAVVLGSISRLGSSYLLLARAVRPGGQTIVTIHQTIIDASHVPAELDVVVQKLRTGLGESASAVQETSAPLERVTSASLEAIRYYTLGKQRLQAGDPQQAVVFLQKALGLDPNFAMAHEYLGVAYSNLEDDGRSIQELYKASQLATRVSEVERYKILGDYNLVSGNFEEACANYQVLAQLQPRDPAPRANLGLCYEGKFDFDSAIRETQAALQIQPVVTAEGNLARFYFLKGDEVKAISTAQELLRSHPSHPEILTTLSRAYLSSGQMTQAEGTFETMVRADGDAEVAGRAGLADLALATGRHREARAQLESTIIAAENRGYKFAATQSRMALAELALAEGTPEQFARAISHVDPTENHPIILLLLGRLYAQGHRPGDAEKIVRTLSTLASQRPFPRHNSFLSLLRAELLLAQGNAAASVEEAQKAVEYENSTLAAETLARCLAAAGKTDEAIRQYELVLARTPERIASYDAPAFHHIVEIHYRLGLLYLKAGQADRGRSELETFLKYWSRPDPDLEIYKDAEKRLRSAAALAPGASGIPTPAT